MVNKPSITRFGLATWGFGQSNFDTAHPRRGSDLNLHTHWRTGSLTIALVALLPMAARAAEMKSTYGQQIVAAVLMGEARGEGEIGMTAVAEVIRNRANEASKSPLQIVLKKGEFSCLNDTTPEALHQKFYRMRTYPMALRIAKTCYNTPETTAQRHEGGNLLRPASRNTPPWLGDVRPVTTIGNHTFYVPK